MRRIRTYDIALVVISASLGAAVALFSRLTMRPDENNLLGLVGSLIGAAIAVIAGLLVLARQFETADERHLHTLRALIGDLRQAGVAMAAPDGPLDAARHVNEAVAAYDACRVVAEDLRSNGPAVARVAERLRNSSVRLELNRLVEAHGAVVPADLAARGTEMVRFADQLTERLRAGL